MSDPSPSPVLSLNLENGSAYAVGLGVMLFFVLISVLAFINKRGPPAVIFLDNPGPDVFAHEYFIVLVTSTRPGASLTDRGTLKIQLIGSLFNSRPYFLRQTDFNHPILQTSTTNIVVVHEDKDLGSVGYILLDVYNTTAEPVCKWRPSFLEVIKASTEQRWGAVYSSKFRARRARSALIKLRPDIEETFDYMKVIAMQHPLTCHYYNRNRFGAFTNFTNIVCIFSYFSALTAATLYSYVFAHKYFGNSPKVMNVVLRDIIFATIAGVAVTSFHDVVEIVLRDVRPYMGLKGRHPSKETARPQKTNRYPFFFDIDFPWKAYEDLPTPREVDNLRVEYLLTSGEESMSGYSTGYTTEDEKSSGDATKRFKFRHGVRRKQKEYDPHSTESSESALNARMNEQIDRQALRTQTAKDPLAPFRPVQKKKRQQTLLMSSELLRRATAVRHEVRELSHITEEVAQSSAVEVSSQESVKADGVTGDGAGEMGGGGEGAPTKGESAVDGQSAEMNAISKKSTGVKKKKKIKGEADTGESTTDKKMGEKSASQGDGVTGGEGTGEVGVVEEGAPTEEMGAVDGQSEETDAVNRESAGGKKKKKKKSKGEADTGESTTDKKKKKRKKSAVVDSLRASKTTAGERGEGTPQEMTAGVGVVDGLLPDNTSVIEAAVADTVEGSYPAEVDPTSQTSAKSKKSKTEKKTPEEASKDEGSEPHEKKKKKKKSEGKEGATDGTGGVEGSEADQDKKSPQATSMAEEGETYLLASPAELEAKGLYFVEVIPDTPAKSEKKKNKDKMPLGETSVAEEGERYTLGGTAPERLQVDVILLVDSTSDKSAKSKKKKKEKKTHEETSESEGSKPHEKKKRKHTKKQVKARDQNHMKRRRKKRKKSLRVGKEHRKGQVEMRDRRQRRKRRRRRRETKTSAGTLHSQTAAVRQT